jgi:hypothetical protein
MNEFEYQSELRQNLMRMDIEELEAKLRTKHFSDDAIPVVTSLIAYKKENPELVDDVKEPSWITRRVVAFVAVGLVGSLILWLRHSGKSKTT